jgi:DNA-directed RNA polymerase specialized sigma24 family protein
VRVTLNPDAIPANDPPLDLLLLDDALSALAKLDARRSQIIELRFFGGLTVEETAVVLKVAPGTVMRDARLAKAWLARQMSAEREDS